MTLIACGWITLQVENPIVITWAIDLLWPIYLLKLNTWSNYIGCVILTMNSCFMFLVKLVTITIIGLITTVIFPPKRAVFVVWLKLIVREHPMVSLLLVHICTIARKNRSHPFLGILKSIEFESSICTYSTMSRYMYSQHTI